MNYFKVKVNGENFVVSITKVQNSAMARFLLSKGDYEDTLAMCMKLKKGLKSKWDLFQFIGYGLKLN